MIIPSPSWRKCTAGSKRFCARQERRFFPTKKSRLTRSAASSMRRAARMPRHDHAAPPQSPATAEPYVPRCFKPEEYRAIEILAEIIIPTDDKPGAKEAQVTRFIDFLVFSAAEFRPSVQTEWTKGL